MRIAESSASLTEFLSDRGLSVDQLGADATVAAMIDWYEQRRVEDAAPLKEDGDMLLYQWSTSDWGDGRWFHFDITRQMIEAGDSDDAGFWQLALTVHYSPTDEADNVGSGNQWCDHPDQGDAFRKMIEQSPARAVAADQVPHHTTLRLGPAG